MGVCDILSFLNHANETLAGKVGKMKRIMMCLLLCISLPHTSRAELPGLTAQELADLIQQQESHIKAFQIKYRLTQGEYSEDGNLVPDVIIDCEYAHNIARGQRYLHETWAKEDLERKYAYDGRIGTMLALKTPGAPERIEGTVMANVPRNLADQAIWKPEWFTYAFIEESNILSDVIRKSDQVDIATQERQGEVYKVTFTATGWNREEIDLPDGTTRWVDTGDTYAAWLAPRKGYLPVKIVQMRGPGGDVLYTCTASDFREITPGTWFPYRLERSRTGQQRTRIIDVNAVAVNNEASVISRLEFPPGTHTTYELNYLTAMLTQFAVYTVSGILIVLGIVTFACLARRRRRAVSAAPSAAAATEIPPRDKAD